MRASLLALSLILGSAMPSFGVPAVVNGDFQNSTAFFGWTQGDSTRSYVTDFNGNKGALLDSGRGGSFPGPPAGGPPSLTVSAIEAALNITSGSLASAAQTGNPGGNTATNGTFLYQTFTAGGPPGGLVFDFNYGSNETLLSGNDVAFVSFTSATYNQVFILGNSTLLGGSGYIDPSFPVATPNYSSTLLGGTQSFSFLLPNTDAFTLGFGILNTGDNIVASGLFVDNVRTFTVPEIDSRAATAPVALVFGFLLVFIDRRRHQYDLSSQ